MLVALPLYRRTWNKATPIIHVLIQCEPPQYLQTQGANQYQDNNYA